MNNLHGEKLVLCAVYEIVFGLFQARVFCQRKNFGTYFTGIHYQFVKPMLGLIDPSGYGGAAQVKGTSIVRFVRYEVGEGIEKAAAKDFATEVAEMAAAAR